MPDILKCDKAFLEPSLADLIFTMKEVDGQEVVAPELLNYVITRITLGTRTPTKNTYCTSSATLAILRDVEAELRRKLIDFYEDQLPSVTVPTKCTLPMP